MCPELQELSIAAWEDFAPAISAYTSQLPQEGKKFYLIGAASSCAELTDQRDLHYVEDETVNFQGLLDILRHRIFCIAMANLWLI